MESGILIYALINSHPKVGYVCATVLKYIIIYFQTYYSMIRAVQEWIIVNVLNKIPGNSQNGILALL